jgi:hypothetical protein
MDKYGLEYSLDYLMSYNAALEPPEIIGPTPDGLRVNAYSSGGEVSGPKIQGKILPMGGDWFTLRPDGIGILDVRVTIKTNDGALIYLSYNGVADLGIDGYEKFMKGENTPQEMHVRTNPKISTAHPNYIWLNRLFCLGIGKLSADGSEIIYDVYAVK